MPKSNDAMATQVQHRLPHGSEAPAAARRAVDVLRDALDPAALGRLRLLVSELVTNAVRHGRPMDGNGVELRVGVDDERARVEVVDGGGGFAPPGAPARAEQVGGWGLMVVDRLADRWGVETNGKTLVWLEFDAPSGVRHVR
ncbi:MAG: ATP-binding protein [Actinomycetota bacterium]|nr:ATP-binding protein [Actinomycetota bacterium]